jgi:PadR family transcriptional regulator, regulatory protein PadR
MVLGELEQVVLLSILRVGDEAYGVPILGEIERQTARSLTLATVYKTLARLEDKGLVASRTGDPTPQRGGRRKRYYALTADGRRALRESLAALRRMTRGLQVGWDHP